MEKKHNNLAKMDNRGHNRGKGVKVTSGPENRNTKL
jgi:hypothetical protein